MKIDLSTIDQTQFDLKVGPHGTLINPRHDKHRWQEHELIYSSLLVDDNGGIVSSGFPKFLNMGENPRNDERFFSYLNNPGEHRVCFTEKLDGSLIIRFVVDNKVYFRTRGSQTLGQFHDEVMAVVQRYPNLLLPDLAKYGSVLLEYTGHQSREDQVVLKYDKSELHILGYVYHDGLLVYTDDNCLDIFSRLFMVPRTPTRDITDLASVQHLEEQEGVVASVSVQPDGHCIQMVKIKTDWYKVRHRLKYCLTDKDFNLYCYINNITTFEEARDHLYSAYGLDYEVTEMMRPGFEEYRTQYEYVRNSLQGLYDHLSAFSLGQTRKVAVAVAKELAQSRILHTAWFNALMAMYDDNPVGALDMIMANVLGCSTMHLYQIRKKPEYADMHVVKFNRREQLEANSTPGH
jgi:hypothetical protein